VFIFERSIATDRCVFMQHELADLDPVQRQQYETWCYNWQDMPFDLRRAQFLFLNPSLDTCMRRVQSRNRKSEVREVKEDENGEQNLGVTRQLQEKLLESHRTLFTDPFPKAYDRPFPISNVLTIEDGLADADFRADHDPDNKALGAIAERLARRGLPSKPWSKLSRLEWLSWWTRRMVMMTRAFARWCVVD